MMCSVSVLHLKNPLTHCQELWCFLYSA